MLEKFNQGDLNAFNQLYNDKFPHLLRLVLWKTGSQFDFGEAEGVVQQAFLKIYKKAATYHGQTDGEAWSWISTTTHHHMLDVIRQKNANEKNLVSLDDETCASHAVLIDELALDMKGWLERFFTSLSEREQQIFRMLSDGIAQKEIAALLGVSMPRITQIIKTIQKKALKFER
ncbi:MAG: sigma-70 family RNA polymerase sigma factor [Chloroflexota bacterium]|jgi:RNA polymerase sigma factor (sigma-70 family)